MAPMRCRSPTNFMRWQHRSVQFEAPQFLSWKIPSSDQQRDTTYVLAISWPIARIVASSCMVEWCHGLPLVGVALYMPRELIYCISLASVPCGPRTQNSKTSERPSSGLRWLFSVKCRSIWNERVDDTTTRSVRPALALKRGFIACEKPLTKLAMAALSSGFTLASRALMMREPILASASRSDSLDASRNSRSVEWPTG